MYDKRQREWDSMIEVLEEEQVDLWRDLDWEIHYAVTHWSVGIENKIRRILKISSVVGFVSPEKVPISLLTSEVYQTILSKRDCSFENPLDESHYRLDTYGRYKYYWADTVSKIKELNFDEF